MCMFHINLFKKTVLYVFLYVHFTNMQLHHLVICHTEKTLNSMHTINSTQHMKKSFIETYITVELRKKMFTLRQLYERCLSLV